MNNNPASILPTGSSVALITGATRGLGKAIALRLARDGHRVVVNFAHNAEAAKDVTDAVIREGGEAISIRADVRDPAQVARLAEEVHARWGGVGIVVHNATGPQKMAALEDYAWEDFAGLFEMFVKAPLLVTQAFLPDMRRLGGGRIILIGSEVFDRGVPRFSAYVAAKGAMVGLMRSWASELAASNITVNVVHPGWIVTEKSRDLDSAIEQAYLRTVPAGRRGTPEEVAHLVASLAAPDAGFITGQSIAVNGGNTLS